MHFMIPVLEKLTILKRWEIHKVLQSRIKWATNKDTILLFALVGFLLNVTLSKNSIMTVSPLLHIYLISITQSPTLWDPMDCSQPGSSFHGILQARILEWVAMSFSRGSSHPGIQPRSPTLQADFLLSEPSGKPRDLYLKNTDLKRYMYSNVHSSIIDNCQDIKAI